MSISIDLDALTMIEAVPVFDVLEYESPRASPCPRHPAPSARGDDTDLNSVCSKPRDNSPASMEILQITLPPSK
ncbi:hypothetical protein B0H14DRAFT_3502877 [Mycena olivaceomarginata]|nr:hypothetical protein B0H14DRAFT_3502877 [Mycena olivaceomarginata]